MRGSETITVTIRLRRDQRELLDAVAVRECRSRNRQVQMLVERALDELAKSELAKSDRVTP
jgi:uncharacterized protein (DUF1778 family)